MHDFCRIRLSPSFWIAALKRIENIYRRPLPCPVGTDITTLPLEKLRDIAIHAYKLKKNWAPESPRPVRVSTLEMGFYDGNADMGVVWNPSIFCVPGTGMIVTVSPNYFTCWDPASGQKIGACDYGDQSVARSEWVYSHPLHRPGMFYLGIASVCEDDIGHRELKLNICTVDYRNPTSTRIVHALSRSCPFPDTYLWLNSAIVKEDAIGVVMLNSDGFRCLIFCRLQDGEMRQLILGPHDQVFRNLVGYAIDEDLCLVSGFSRNILEFVHTAVTIRPSYPVTIVEIPTPQDGEALALPPPLSDIQFPTCGVLYARPDGNQVKFFPAEWERPILSLGIPFSYNHSETVTWMDPTPSLSSALICSASGLGLLQYTPGG